MPASCCAGKELIPVHIEARMNTSSGGMLQRRRHAHRRVAAADLALFTRQLATLVQAANAAGNLLTGGQ
ncbi:type II secretion system protein F [Escherichia coli]|uniref:Type II secretion system protein F n=1 Tax=Escherichia coli TaxID=562 RepID=A0A376NW60_ECOLX|nr:type II secretion system protein F [Escherichia coli]